MQTTEDDRERYTQFYLVFISIVFAVFLSVWIVPIGDLFDVAGEKPEDVLEAFLSERNIRGVVMFAILVSLWWWYGKFLGQLDPATGFVMFGYDFVSLGSFAIAFRVWPQPIVFSAAVCFAALLMLIRFEFTNRILKKQRFSKYCPARKAIRAAIFILGAFILNSSVTLFWAASIMFGSDDTTLPIRLSPTPTICSVSPWTAGKGRHRRIEEAIRLIPDCSENRTGV